MCTYMHDMIDNPRESGFVSLSQKNANINPREH